MPREARTLYDLLEQQVIPEFYTRIPDGIPTAWVARMRESMARLTPRFSANRDDPPIHGTVLPARCGDL